MKRKSTSHHARKRRRNSPMDVYVVDLHNGAMLPFVDAVKHRELPRTGNKMLHYDSHPDLGNIEKRSSFLYQAAQGKFNKSGIYDMTDIATWITPLVLAGQLDEVVWVAGHWCKQIKEGTYHLVCGLDKNDGKLKTADADGSNTSHAVENYWECDDCAGELGDLNFQAPWTLHVVKYAKDGSLSPAQTQRIRNVLMGQPWVLDIDEDFFSCNNPYRDAFEACFGTRTFLLMRKIYEIGTGVDTHVKRLLAKKVFMKPKADFMAHSSTVKVVRALEEEGMPGRKLMEEFHDSFNVYFKSTAKPLIKVESLVDFEDMHTTGQLATLPHHISRVDEIARMADTTAKLLRSLDRPVHVTLATSRSDRYLPDAQAALIHGMLDEMMEIVYEDVNVIRRDLPEFSVNIDD